MLTPALVCVTLPVVMASNDRIILEGMTFYGFHGNKPEERDLGQRFVVDLEVGADLSAAGRSDNLTDTLDYGNLYATVKEIVEGEPLHLIEAVAERIASRTLDDPKADWVRVRVHKPSAPVRGAIMRGATVEITRPAPRNAR